MGGHLRIVWSHACRVVPKWSPARAAFHALTLWQLAALQLNSDFQEALLIHVDPSLAAEQA
jgi:hypothetical protein